MKKSAALLWDESFLWGLMAYRALKTNNLPFELIRSEDIKKGSLRDYEMLFVPGGWASNKLKALGDEGIREIKGFVYNGGNYLGFCGGAGLATLDGIGLLNIKRRATNQRLPSFSGRIYLNINKHYIWSKLKPDKKIGKHKDNSKSDSSLTTHRLSLPFYAWWPSQFVINDKKIEILATYGKALPDSFSSDLNVGDIEANYNWSELERLYKINLDPKLLLNEPAVVEGNYGSGKVILSLLHFDTPNDKNSKIVLKNLWNYLVKTEENNSKRSKAQGRKTSKPQNFKTFPIISELESLVEELISFGSRNFLWFWRNPMLLQWRRGVRGLEYCTLYIMIKEMSKIIKRLDKKDEVIISNLESIKKLLIPFTEKAKQLLILERFAMKHGHITYEKCDDPKVQKIRLELFGNSKSYGGLFKRLVDQIDFTLYQLLKL